MPGNQFGDKLNAKQKQQAYKQYCKHIASGLSKEAWSYKDPNDNDLTIMWQTMESYIKDSPKAFNASQLGQAYATSRKFFEETGLAMMTGKNCRGNAAIFQIFMRNKFGWDRELIQKEENKCIFNDTLKALKVEIS